ncbi:MAG TPA: phosphatidylinositol mannoside acyltransferase [Jatrophihabitantaceae bacterium]
MNVGDLRARAVDLSFAAGWGAVKALPSPFARRAFRTVADVATVRNGKGAQQLRKNLRRVVPQASDAELDELVGEGLRSYARYWLETFRLPKMDPRAVAANAEANTTGAEHIDAAVRAGKGFILALPHMGNWDAAAIWLVAHCGSFTTVAERLKPESLYDRFVAYRESLGMEVLPLTGGASPAETLAERLRAGRAVCLLADRDLSRNGVEVEFFGEATRMPGGPALLAATTGAALLPVSLWFTADGGWGQWIGPPVELTGKRLAEKVRAGTQALASVFETRIAEHPSDWHMLQKLWLSDLSVRTAPLNGHRH